MSRTWFAEDLETVATFWRVMRRDGVTLGFTSHDRDIWFDGVLHSAAPGMVPSSIRRTSGVEADSAEVQGALSHEAITAADLMAGRYDAAQVRIGLVDWETRERLILYRGTIGGVTEEDGRFTADLASRKVELTQDHIPRTSPTCRASFCGPGCNLSPTTFTHEAALLAADIAANAVSLDLAAPSAFIGGWIRWLEGPQAGITMTVMAERAGSLVLDLPLEEGLPAGAKVIAREGCDHTLGTCSTRFANAANFQGEPFLPGNDQITRYNSA